MKAHTCLSTPRWRWPSPARAVGIVALVGLAAFPHRASSTVGRPAVKEPPPRAVPGLRAPAGWTHGAWKHGWHGGRFGWWWRSQGRWYFYLTPFRPYPPYYGSGPIPIGEILPGTVLPASPVGGPSPPSLSRWYCVSPPGFYPFVTSCSGGWLETGQPALVVPYPVPYPAPPPLPPPPPPPHG